MAEQPPWYVECVQCGGPFVGYCAEAPPPYGTRVEPEVNAGLLRHMDGRVVAMAEIARCDTCGCTVDALDFYEVQLHPRQFRRTPS